MVAKAHELQKSRAIRFDKRNPGTSFEFFVTGAAEGDIAGVLLPLCPQTYQGFSRKPWSATPLGGGVWEASVPYGVPDDGESPPLFPGEDPESATEAADPTIPDMTRPGPPGEPFTRADPFSREYPESGAGGNRQEVDKNTPLGPEWGFTTTGGTRTVRQALLDFSKGGEPSRYYKTGGIPTNFAGAVGVQKNGGGYTVEGKDAPEPKLDLKTTRTVRAISLEYIGLIAAITGSVNKYPFAGLAAGELLFLGADGQYKPPAGPGVAGGWSITFQFAAAPNLYSPEEPPPDYLGDPEDWPGIEIASGQYLPPGEQKDGWDLLEVMFEEKPSGGRLLPTAEQFAIHRIFPRADFRYLGFETLAF